MTFRFDEIVYFESFDSDGAFIEEIKCERMTNITPKNRHAY